MFQNLQKVIGAAEGRFNLEVVSDSVAVTIECCCRFVFQNFQKVIGAAEGRFNLEKV